ncbi:MAG: hypothetical protein N2379_08590 [Verrucomicrobiae bacterium]|nr:hypothetical protein [Verrucomicrobiae bacterium]
MNSNRSRFNLFLAAALALGLSCGCQSGKLKGPVTVLRLHMEASPGQTEFVVPVNVGRSMPVQILIEKSAFLDERDVADAAVVDQNGTFSLKLVLTRRGKWLLEQYSASNLGRRCAIFCHFGTAKSAVSRWLAAPQFTRIISDGVLVFTPDATRAEAEQIVAGLRNVARQTAKERGPLD